MTMSDIRYEGQSGRRGAVMTAVVVNGPKGKEYRLPTDHEIEVAEVSEERLQALYAEIPFGLPEEPLPSKEALGFRVPLYGFDTWRKLFTNRQLLALGVFVRALREMPNELADYPADWCEGLISSLALVIDRTADYSSIICSWINSLEALRNTFTRFALPIVWDYAEANPLSETAGSFIGALGWVSSANAHVLQSAELSKVTKVQDVSATKASGEYDAIITDPPYYDAIPYSDCMDFFHVWLRRTTNGLSPEIDMAFQNPLGGVVKVI